MTYSLKQTLHGFIFFVVVQHKSCVDKVKLECIPQSLEKPLQVSS